MHTSTETSSPRAVNEPHLPLDIMQPQDASVTPTSSSDRTSIADGTLPPNVQRTPSNCIIIIQNNCIAEGGTINIFSSNCTGSTVTMLDHVVAPTKEPTLLQPPLTMQPEPVELGRDSIVLSGNWFGECVMINVGSPNCTGALKQTVNGVPK
ncbi:hypothetical protein K503DRAFT_774937 [Rhizopogon vinicolor AM-OR11-026]|uniref:Uncharacterized protein n=1 Tax=Rhizopogon vinicolor AM-OR11-026 TaxID=1314800 RepID=A0A1B7MNA4_9AGAM|nr:hypothetical protein K503DRAFT_774937 [Rhizopogon vinicolor AM-OR11-026]